MPQELPKLSETDFSGENREELAKSVDKFNNALDEWSKWCNEDSRKFEKRRKPLPEKLYHITTRENAEQIMQEGLDPARLMAEDREVVSLSDDIDFAIGVAEETQKTKREQLVVLEIDTRYLTPSRVYNYLTEADPSNPNPVLAAAAHEVHYELNIPPEAIRIIKQDKKK